jgi:carboxyl-terminal processing protease
MPMRCKRGLGVLILGGTFLFLRSGAQAQPPEPSLPPLPPRPDVVRTAPNGSAYAHNTFYTIDLIETGYVRPIDKLELLVAAISGLYEVAGESVPASLRADAEKAIKAGEELHILERTRKRTEIARRLSDEEALLASCRAMLRTLDPYCEIVMGDEARRSSGRMDNYGVGIDLEDAGGAEGVRIKEVLPGSPGQKAGLRPGDRITAIDSKALKNLNPFQATVLLNGQTSGLGMNSDAGRSGSVGLDDSLTPSKVRVVLKRDADNRTYDLIVERRSFQAETVFGVRRRDDNTWDYWIDRERGIAQVRIGALRDDTADQLRLALAKLNEAGMRGLLLDLRWCPGGLLAQSIESAGLFLQKGRIATIKGRTVGAGPQGFEGQAKLRAETRLDHDTAESGPFKDVPMLVLVNGESSGGAELIAAAIQDQGRAAIAGQRTRGKASVQTMSALPGRGAFMKLTTGVFLRPSGKNLNRFPDSKTSDDWGVRPNDGLEFRISTELNRHLREWWAAQTLRPGGSYERLPLDDPNADPQRQLALQALRSRLK